MKMPLTAIALIFEFTRIGHDFLIPISLAVAGSTCVFFLCTEYNFQFSTRLTPSAFRHCSQKATTT
jgi:hypothetical protein